MARQYHCFYCGKILSPKQKSRDHLQPRSKNGSDTPRNIVAACRKCNGEKGCLTLEEFRLVVAFRNGLLKRIIMPFPGEIEEGEMHITTGTVLDDLGFSPEVAAELKKKSDLHTKIMKTIKKRSLSFESLVVLLSKPKHRVQKLLKGKLSKFELAELAEINNLLSPSITVHECERGTPTSS